MLQSLKQHCKAVWTKSWTQGLGITKVLVGSAGALVHYVGHLVNDPGVHSYIEKYDLPLWAGLSLAVLGAMTLISMEHDA